MSAGHGSGKSWIYMLVGGSAAIGVGMGLHHAAAGPGWLYAALLAIGGLAVVFAACDAMVKCVDGASRRAGTSEFVGGTMAGLASNIPELVMIGFIVASEPRIAFILTALTLHVGALTFGVYSALLPRDETGHASMPRPLVELSTDLYACAGVLLFATGAVMVVLQAFGSSKTTTPALTAGDLYVLGGSLIAVEIVAVVRLIRRFSAEEQPEGADGAVGTAEVAADVAPETASSAEHGADEVPSIGSIVFFGVVGVAASVLGGHAVGDFADLLVGHLTHEGYSEMIGALVLSFFSCSSVFVMIVTTHVKGKYDLAIANVSGAVTQVPFVVWPVVMIMYAAFAQTGVIPEIPGGGVLPIDLETTSVVLLGFPPMLILWKSIQDDGKVNWVETASMLALFVCILYFLGVHG